MNIQHARKCLQTLTFYGQFNVGQDGYAAIQELTAFVDEVERSLLPKAICPAKKDKPPLWLTPRHVHLENRQNDIVEAIIRYRRDKGLRLPIEWLRELMDNQSLLEEEAK